MDKRPAEKQRLEEEHRRENMERNCGLKHWFEGQNWRGKAMMDEDDEDEDE